MKAGKLIFLMVITAYIFIAVTYSFYSVYSKPIFVREIGMEVKVVDEGVMGFNADWDALYFGTVYAGMSAKRHINLTNLFERDTVVVIESDDSEIAKWVSVGENIISLKAGESKRVDVSLSCPENVSVGEYTGKMYVTYKKE